MSKFCEIRKDNYQEDINFEQKNIEKVEPIELLLTMEELQSYNIKKNFLHIRGQIWLPLSKF